MLVYRLYRSLYNALYRVHLIAIAYNIEYLLILIAFLYGFVTQQLLTAEQAAAVVFLVCLNLSF